MGLEVRVLDSRGQVRNHGLTQVLAAAHDLMADAAMEKPVSRDAARRVCGRLAALLRSVTR
jgi:hypothetical protein